MNRLQAGGPRRSWAMTVIGVAILIAVIVFLVAGCSGKYTEPYKDAPRSGVTNDDAAETITFPDGFNNLATKCDHGNRVYVTYHSDSPYGAVAVVPNAKGC